MLDLLLIGGVGSFAPGWLGDLDWQVAVLDLVVVGFCFVIACSMGIVVLCCVGRFYGFVFMLL